MCGGIKYVRQCLGASAAFASDGIGSSIDFLSSDRLPVVYSSAIPDKRTYTSTGAGVLLFVSFVPLSFLPSYQRCSFELASRNGDENLRALAAFECLLTADRTQKERRERVKQNVLILVVVVVNE